MRKELAALKRNIKAGLGGPDAELYRMMNTAIKALHFPTR
jgi:hypothetical protein